MDLITPVQVLQSKSKISHKDSLYTVGSCFSKTVGDRFADSGFHISVDGMGTLFNPVSILKNLNMVTKNTITANDSLFVFSQDRYFHLEFSSLFSHSDQQVLANNIQDTLEKQYLLFTKADYIFITWGSAWVYKYLQTGDVVASCHKIPQNNFEKLLLSLDEIKEGWDKFLKKYPDKTFVFTLSPVRHTKDGMVENMQSKSRLHMAISDLVLTNSNALYFPSYEVMMDELRDYRFYERDLIHPNSLAIDIIFEKLAFSFFDDETKRIIKEYHNLSALFHHKVLSSEEVHAEALERQKQEKKKDFTNKYPFVSINF